MKLHNVEIELKDGTIFGGKVLIDDKEILGIRSIDFSTSVEKANILKLELIVDKVKVTGDILLQFEISGASLVISE